MTRINTSEPKKAALVQNKNTLWRMVDSLCLFLGFLVSAILFCGGFGFIVSMTPRCYFEAATCIMFGMFFPWAFEMYSDMMMTRATMLVTVVLSCVYSFACALILELVLYATVSNFMFLLWGCLIGFAMLLAWRSVLSIYNSHNASRLKLLMIEKFNDDNSRVRRMKYACLISFDAWYEQVDVYDIDKVNLFIKERFPAYDAICLMESVPLEVRDLFLREGNKMGKQFYIVPDLYEMNFAKIRLTFFDDVMVFHLLPDHINPVKMVIKRIGDIAISLIGCAIAAIPMAVIAAFIKLSSPGPVIYKQTRYTKDKREFEIYKFRTMVQNAEDITGPVIAVKDDPRVTKIGKILRKSRMDELPQLINILKGDMSVVGPRPERPYFVEQYEKTVDNYSRRFEVKAGLTALSHVYGRYSTDINDRTRYDLLYIQNYSLMLDFKIILLTSRTIFLSDAAEGVWTVDRRAAL